MGNKKEKKDTKKQNGSREANMEALVDDAEAMAIGMFVSIAISLILCMSSVALINWSALRQEHDEAERRNG
ncbi:hypothetical protein MSG28_000938 [Choristoneura fumiferana]|uniref:Uncharacterized protein n=1 Tax=Choristoneura fumiferana TaxID=7141 RepID=A0ACC0K300_CHOFU|nr:hypothetical protein MSG28_000938 [Choristoneura fumiferana]